MKTGNEKIVSQTFAFNSLIPEFSVSDFKKSLEFYTQVLGFGIQYERSEDQFAFLCLGQCQIILAPDGYLLRFSQGLGSKKYVDHGK